MDVKYLSPSTGHLTGVCKIDPKVQKQIRDRYFQGKRVLVTLPIEFTSNGQVVAQAKLRYFAQPTIQLLNSGSKLSTLSSQKLKASARMIAGVRASEEAESKVRVDCPHAEVAAGPHGKMLATRLRQALPQIPANFLHDDVPQKLLEHPQFDPNRPTAFIYEGCSMYFDEQQNQTLLRGVWDLAKHPDSKIWCDLVTTAVVNSETERPEVEQFLSRMDDLGETFIFGADAPEEFLNSIGCRAAQSKTCREYLDTDETIFDVYQFCVGGNAC